MQIMNRQLYSDLVVWILEPDPQNPGVRYFALRDLLGRSDDDPQLQEAQREIMCSGPVPKILDAQQPEGYWAKPGGGHSPSYQVTVWQIIFLAELGADPNDERVRWGCEYFLNHSVAANGGFAMNPRPVPSSVVHCLNGDPLHALLKLGYISDPRIQNALNWLTQAATGESGVRFYKSGTSARGFSCAYNLGQPCGWGATKAMKALSALARDQRTPAIDLAINVGSEYLLGCDPAKANYPFTERINSTWFSFGFPLSYRSDILETALVLADLGRGEDPRLQNAHRFIMGKQDENGHWIMEKSLNGKLWANIEEKGQPSKWITLRALHALGIGKPIIRRPHSQPLERTPR
jgi:hypothetical protein